MKANRKSNIQELTFLPQAVKQLGPSKNPKKYFLKYLTDTLNLYNSIQPSPNPNMVSNQLAKQHDSIKIQLLRLIGIITVEFPDIYQEICTMFPESSSLGTLCVKLNKSKVIHNDFLLDEFEQTLLVDIYQLARIIKTQLSKKVSWFTGSGYCYCESPQELMKLYLEEWINEESIPSIIQEKKHIADKLLKDYFNREYKLEDPTILNLRNYFNGSLLPLSILTLIFRYNVIININLERCEMAQEEYNRLFEFLADKGIRNLSLRSCKLQCLPVNICLLQELTELNLNGNVLLDADTLIYLTNHRKLISLDLSYCNIKYLPEKLKLLELKNLDLSSNLLNSFPGFSSWQFPNLEKLVNCRIPFKRIDRESIRSLKSLEHLNISSCILEAESLQVLLQCLPTSIKFLSMLSCKIASLPNELFKLTNLRSLYISNNNLQPIPDDLENLINLETLYCANCGLTSVPKAISKMSNLKIMNLSNNPLHTLPEGVFMDLINLERLYMCWCKLDTFAPALTTIGTVAGANSLKELVLRNNPFKEIPANAFNNYANLQNLDLGNTSLTIFPEAVYDLHNLLNLNLIDNKIVRLPREVLQNLLNLEMLDLVRNLVSHFDGINERLLQLRIFDGFLFNIYGTPFIETNQENIAKWAKKVAFAKVIEYNKS